MGIRRLAIVLAALAPACSLFVSVDGLSGGDTSNDGGGTSDAPTSADANGASDSPLTGTDGSGVDSGNAYVAAVLGDSPIGYWRFEETTGTNVHDEMGAHDGTFVGNTTRGVPGVAGNAATFDGETTCVSVGGGSTFIFPNEAPFTVEAWVFTPTTRAPVGWVASSELLNPNPYPRYGWSLYVDSNGFGDGDGWNADYPDSGSFIFGGYSFNSSGAPITPQAWTQIVMSYATNGHVTISINGNPRDGSGSTAFLSTHAGSLSFGCRDAANASYLYTGSLDEISIYDKTLSASQILAHYQAATSK
jgi:hypothetical protein